MTIIHPGHGEETAPRDDHIPSAPGDPGRSIVRELAAAAVTASIISATEAGQKQDPDQPFTAIISTTAVVITQQTAAIVIAASTTAEQ